jgi:PHP family Zn ribbon phosphoesterase
MSTSHDPSRPLPPDAADGRLDVIACDRCGRSFATEDGPGMLAAIKGACPECGGTFQMIAGSEGAASA